MKLNISYIILLAVTVLLNGCKNDLKLNAPYKEYPSVYALVNPQDKIQMIRINKVFLGEGNAFDMAKVADSLNYPAGELTVTLERYVNDVKALATPTGPKDVITFHDSIIQTLSGTFNSTQRVYVSGDKLYTTGEYRLKIYNNHTKNSFTAKANAIDSIPYSPYPPFNDTHYGSPLGHYYGDPDNVNHLADPSVWINYNKPTTNYTIRFFPSPTSAKVFQLTMRLHFYDKTIQGDSTLHYVDFNFTKQNAKDASTFAGLGPFINYPFRGSDIYETVAGELSKHPTTPLDQLFGRAMLKVGFIVYTSTQEYQDYLDFNSTSLSIAQEKPLYTNFDNKAALGIFAFRSRCFIERELAVETKDEFANYSSTCRQKFMVVSNGPPHTNQNCP